jgi:hypothetical protein
VVLVALAGLSGCKKPVTPPAADGGTCGAPTATTLRLLTRAEYDATVADVLGDTTRPAASTFPGEPLVHGFDNNAQLDTVGDDLIADYLTAAEALAGTARAKDHRRLYTCDPAETTCGQRFLSSFGRRLYRRPLSADELTSLSLLFDSVKATHDFDTAVEWSVQAMLQSPQFLYRDEHVETTAKVASLTGYPLATRLSYFLWASTPDDELLDAAGAGTLDTADGLAAQAERMLADPRAVNGKLRFFTLYFNTAGAALAEKSAAVYTAYTPALAQAWRQSLELFFTDLAQHDGTLTAMLTSPVVFTNGTMNMYGAADAGTADFVRNELSATQRPGLLGQPGLMARLAAPDQSSPIRRGVFVLEKLLCQPTPPPPGGVIPPPPAPTTGQTTRDRFAQHDTDPNCSGCHRFIDPVGFTMEHFDGVGAWRDTENGITIDATGGVVSASDQSLVVHVNDVVGLSHVLAQSRQVHDCLATEYLRFALGRDLDDQDTCTLTQVRERFAQSDRFDELILGIVTSDAFRTYSNPEAK